MAYGAESGGREILIPASGMVPSVSTLPLAVEGYEWSSDGSKVLIFTNTRRVWRDNTRGDYWVLDREAGTDARMGPDFPDGTLIAALVHGS